MKNTVRHFRSQEEAESAYHQAVTVMARLLDWWSKEDRAKGADQLSVWYPLTYWADGTKICGISIPTSSVFATLVTRGATPTHKSSGNGSSGLLGNRPTMIYIDDLEEKNDTNEIHGVQDSHYPANRQVPILPKRGYPCRDCPLQKRDSPSSGSLREAFRAVEKRAGKRNAKAKN
jgi:hypothetical protein